VTPASIFVSRQWVLTDAQHATFRRWATALDQRGVVLRTLPRDEYRRDPWPLLLARLRPADGVVVFGFRHAGPAGAVRASPWTQIEAGLAIAADLPLLVLPERGVSDGVFDPATWGRRVLGSELTDLPDQGLLDVFIGTVGAQGPTLAAV
jgi:hypothetical protein